MYKCKWEVDDHTVVEFKGGLFGKETILVNGTVASEKRNLTHRSVTEFKLPQYREGKLKISSSLMRPEFELRVDNQLILPTTKNSLEYAYRCRNCATENKINDRFCHSCGTEMPSPELIHKEAKVKEATTVIKVLAVMFILFGGLMFFMQKGQYDQALAQISTYQDHETFPNLINGKKYIVSDLKLQINLEKYGVLGLNIFLSLIMVGLMFYAKKSPLGALIVATAVYVSIHVLNAMVDPTTIGQGFIMKMIIIGMLIKGIRSALELKAVHAK